MKQINTAKFLRKRGLNHGFKLEGGEWKGTLIELLNDFKSEGQTLPLDSVRQRALEWWRELPDNGEGSKYQISYKHLDKHWMGLNKEDIVHLYNSHVA